MFARLFRSSPVKEAGRRLYQAVTEQARTPAFYAEPEYGTGQWGTPVARCQDASANVPLCAAVAAALATETDATKLRNFAAQVSAMGYPKAAEALRVKASMISG